MLVPVLADQETLVRDRKISFLKQINLQTRRANHLFLQVLDPDLHHPFLEMLLCKEKN